MKSYCDNLKFDVIILTDIIGYSNLIRTSTEFLDILTSIKAHDNKIFLYYSGHGQLNTIMTPDNDEIEARSVLDLIAKDNNCDIFIVMDCCHASSMMLMYKLVNRKLRLRDYGNYIAIKNRVILLTGANEDDKEKAISSKTGSIFTKKFYEMITNKMDDYDFTTIIQKINQMVFEERNGYIQTTCIYTSKMMEQVLWNWLWPSYNGKDIYYDDKRHCIVIDKLGFDNKNGNYC